jgi:nicotinamide riboside transporter PnuC
VSKNLSNLFSDAVWFLLLQAGIVLFALFAALRDRIEVRKAGRGNLTMQITRRDASMKIFYGTRTVITVILVAICLSVDAAKGQRVLWLLVDIIAVGYVCLLNGWFRNHLVGLASYLTKLEKR